MKPNMEHNDLLLHPLGDKMAPHRACHGTGYIDICELHHKKATRQCRERHPREIVPHACTDLNFGKGDGCGMMGWAPKGTPGHFGGAR